MSKNCAIIDNYLNFMHKELLDFIDEHLKRGHSKDEIRIALAKHGGWEYGEIKLAFRLAEIRNTPAKKVAILDAGIKTPLLKQEERTEKLFSEKIKISVPPPKKPLPIEAKTETKLIGEAETIAKEKRIITSVINIFKKSLDIFSKRASVIIPINLVPFIFIIPLFYLVEEMNENYFYFLLLFSFLTLFFSFVAHSSTLYAFKTNIGFFDIYVHGFSRTYSLVWILFLILCISLGGYLFFIIPGLFLSFWFVFAPFILFDQKIRGMNALIKSKEYCMSNWKFILPQVVLLGIVPIVLIITFKYIVENLIFGILYSLVASFIFPYFVICFYVLYKDVVAFRGKFEFITKDDSKIPYLVFGLCGFLFLLFLVFSM